MNKARKQQTVLVVVMLAIAAPGAARAQTLRGEVLSEQLCSQCHAVRSGQQSPKAVAPPSARIAADPSITELSLRVFLRTPHWTMPDIVVKPDDASDIIDYILSLKAKP